MTTNQAKKLSIEFAKYTHDEGYHYDAESGKWLFDNEWLSSEEVLNFFNEELVRTGRIYELASDLLSEEK